MSKAKTVTLVKAAGIAKLSYQGMRDLVLRGRVKGWQPAGTKAWLVSRESLEKYIRERRRQSHASQVS